MNVIVSGATGFIGSHVCRRLVSLGHNVHALSEPGASRDRLKDIEALMRWTEIDLFHAEERELDGISGGADMAIHCAWYAVPGAYLTAFENLSALSGSLRFFAALWRNGCRRVVGVGTCIEYQMDVRPLVESSPVNPATLYAATKLSTFFTGRELSRQMNGSFAWARLFYLYGPYEARSRLVPDLCINLLQGKRVAVTEGRQIRDYLHVEDVASALVAIGLSSSEGAFNVGSGKPLSVRTMIEIASRYAGHPELVDYGARPSNLVDPPHILADNQRLLRETAWRTTYSLESGLAGTINWWRNNLPCS